jgi:hypothetical protein
VKSKNIKLIMGAACGAPEKQDHDERITKYISLYLDNERVITV